MQNPARTPSNLAERSSVTSGRRACRRRGGDDGRWTRWSGGFSVASAESSTGAELTTLSRVVRSGLHRGGPLRTARIRPAIRAPSPRWTVSLSLPPRGLRTRRSGSSSSRISGEQRSDPLREHIRHAAADSGRRVRWLADQRRERRRGHESAGHVRGRQSRLVIPAGAATYSDPVTLPFAAGDSLSRLDGRKLAVSFHLSARPVR